MDITFLYKRIPVGHGRGKGAMVEDVDGNRYIDWMAGIAGLLNRLQPS